MPRSALHRLALLAAVLLLAACGAVSDPPSASPAPAAAGGAPQPAAEPVEPAISDSAAQTPAARRTPAQRGTTAVAEAPPQPPPREPERPVAGHAEVEIPKIGVSAPVIALGLNEDRTMEVPTQPGLAGWYQYSPAPGARGPSIIAAHVSLNGRPDVFYRLVELEPGDEVTVRYRDGLTVTFVVYAVEQQPKDAFPTDQVYGDTEGPELRLITCGGEFDRSERSYRDNVIAYAHATAVS